MLLIQVFLRRIKYIYVYICWVCAALHLEDDSQTTRRDRAVALVLDQRKLLGKCCLRYIRCGHLSVYVLLGECVCEWVCVCVAGCGAFLCLHLAI